MDISPLCQFAPWTFRPPGAWVLPEYAGIVEYIHGAKRLGGGRNVQRQTDQGAKRPVTLQHGYDTGS